MSIFGKWFGFDQEEVFDEGMAAFDRGDYEVAIEAFEECLSHEPEGQVLRLSSFYLAESLTMQGQHLLERGQAWAALRNFETALQRFPGFPELNLYAARACRELGARHRAYAYASRALEINPDYVMALLMQAILLRELNQPTEALHRLQTALHLDPTLTPAQDSPERFSIQDLLTWSQSPTPHPTQIHLL